MMQNPFAVSMVLKYDFGIQTFFRFVDYGLLPVENNKTN
jgi:hypothetical protein